MLQCVSDKQIVNTFLNHLRGKKYVAIVAVVEGDRMILQSSEDFTYTTVSIVNATCDGTFSFILTNIIEFLSPDISEQVVITVSGTNIRIKQGKIEFSVESVESSLLEIDVNRFEELCTISSSTLQDILSNNRNLYSMSKLLTEGIPPITFYNNDSYCMYSNTISFCKGVIGIPNIEIPYNIFNAITKSLSRVNKIKLKLDYEYGLLLFEFNENDYIVLDYKEHNTEVSKSINNIIKNMDYCGKCNPNIISQLGIIYKVLPKETVTLTLYQTGELGVTFELSLGQSLNIGYKEAPVHFNIILSTAQLDSFIKMFRNTQSIEVYKTSNIVLFKTENSGNLLLSGFTF